jgi:hypothetical protein
MKRPGRSLALLCTLALAGCQPAPSSAPASAPATQPAASAAPVEEGTSLVLKLETAVSTATARVGDTVVARLAEPVRKGEKVVLAEGAELRGRVMTAVPAGGKDPAHLVVEFELLVVNGKSQQIDASPIDVTAEAATDGKAKEAELAAGSQLKVTLHQGTKIEG